MGKRQDREGEGVDDDASFDAIGEPQNDDQQHVRQCQEPRGPSALPGQSAQHRGTKVEMGPQAEPAARQADDRHGAEEHDPERGADAEHQLLGQVERQGRRLTPAYRGEQEVGRDHDDVVDRRGEHRQRERALGVQHRRGDEVRGVEQDLGKEEPQQERPELHLGLPDRRRVHARHQDPHDPRPRHHSGGDQRREEPEDRAEHDAGGLLGGVAVTRVDRLDHDGHQDGLEHAGGEELEEDVRDRVRGLVGVAEVRRAEHGSDDDDPDEPGAPADGGEHRHPTGRPIAVPDRLGHHHRWERIVGRLDERRLRLRLYRRSGRPVSSGSTVIPPVTSSGTGAVAPEPDAVMTDAARRWSVNGEHERQSTVRLLEVVDRAQPFGAVGLAQLRQRLAALGFARAGWSSPAPSGRASRASPTVTTAPVDADDRAGERDHGRRRRLGSLGGRRP